MKSVTDEIIIIKKKIFFGRFLQRRYPLNF